LVLLQMVAQTPWLQSCPLGQLASLWHSEPGTWLCAVGLASEGLVLAVVLAASGATPVEPAGVQKLPLALMVHVPPPQSALEWQPGQQPMVVQMFPAEQSAFVVHGGKVRELPVATGGWTLLFSRVQPAPVATSIVAARAPTSLLRMGRDILRLRLVPLRSLPIQAPCRQRPRATDIGSRRMRDRPAPAGARE
jgi:hypothetical protein